MTEQLPEPLVPAEVDLRDYAFYPLEFRRLFASETWILANAEERCAALCLWCEAWHGTPAGSLPDNDKMLAHLSQAGARWPKVKEQVLRGWVKCSDGRLYHSVVSEKALDAWAKHKKASSKGKAGASKRWGTKNSTGISTGNATANSTGISAGITQPLAENSKRIGIGIGIGNKSIAQQTVFETPKSDPQPPPDAHAASQVENQPPNPYAEMAIALRNQGVECTSMHPLVVQWVDAKVSINQALEAVALVRIDKPAPEKIAAKYLDYKIQKIVNPQQVTSVVQPQKPRDTCTHSDGRGTCGMPHAKPDPRQGGAMRCQHHTEISPPNTPESSQAAREAMGKVRVLLGSVNARGGPNKQEFTINKTAGVAS